LCGFTITLGYSRRMMAEATTASSWETLLRIYESAFRRWGAVPEEMLCDRMKTDWNDTDERREIVWSAVFLETVNHHPPRAFHGDVTLFGSRVCQIRKTYVW